MPDIDPSQPNQLIDELFSLHADEVIGFKELFSEEITAICTNLSKAWPLFEKMAQSYDSIQQRSLVCNFIYYMIESCFSSTKLLSMGFLVASGNVLRQSMESMFMAILCSHTGNLIRKENRKETTFNFYEQLIAGKSHTQAHKAAGHIEFNAATLSVNSISASNMARVRGFYNEYSHVSALALRSRVTGNDQSIFLFGGGFHEGQKEQYQKELQSRLAYTRLFENFLCSMMLRLTAISDTPNSPA